MIVSAISKPDHSKVELAEVIAMALSITLAQRFVPQWASSGGRSMPAFIGRSIASSK
jgi:hypothetical protein